MIEGLTSVSKIPIGLAEGKNVAAVLHEIVKNSGEKIGATNLGRVKIDQAVSISK